MLLRIVMEGECQGSSPTWEVARCGLVAVAPPREVYVHMSALTYRLGRILGPVDDRPLWGRWCASTSGPAGGSPGSRCRSSRPRWRSPPRAWRVWLRGLPSTESPAAAPELQLWDEGGEETPQVRGPAA